MEGSPALADLPRGVRGDSERCPLALATGLIVDGDAYYPPSGRLVALGRLPERVALFALLFDQGRYPNLTDSPTEGDR